MIHALKPYPATRDSGVPWLGLVPQGWAVMRSKRLFAPRTELARPDDIQLSATQAYGVIPQVDYERAVGRKIVRILQHLEKRRHVEVDDFVISMRSFQGGLERAWASGCIRSSYVVLRAVTDLNVGYYAYLFKSNGYIRALQSTANFIRDGQDLNFDNFCSVDLLFPSLGEQAAIVRFLDHADRRIRRYIRAKQKLIKLLEEQKQAIIHRAVTRGLDPDARLKPSGLKWLGDDVPEHWEVLPLRRRCVVIDCKHVTVPFVDDGIPLASVREVQTFDLALDKAKRTSNDWYEKLIEGNRRPKRGDIIYCRNVSVGAAAIVGSDEPCAMGQDVCLIRSEENSRYINYFLHSSAMKRQLATVLVGSTFDRINVEEVKALTLLFPPRPEQDAISSTLDRMIEDCDAPVSAAIQEIGLLKEYRTRLIADVVTGKLDVREAAARLPEEVDESESLGEHQADSAEPVDDLDAVPEEIEA